MTSMTIAAAKRRPGRPALGLSPEEREQRKRESRAKSNAKVRNVTLDADIVDELGKVEDRLEAELGFRPTHSQAIKWMIRKSMRELQP